MTTYSAIEAVIKEGIIYPIEPEKLPRDGKLIIMIVLEDEQKMQPDRAKISHLLGWLKSDVDSVDWQKQIRAEWNNRT